MRFFDLGFLFLLLPAAAALYYCVPKRHKPLALTVISLIFFYFVSPKYSVLALFIIPDMLFVSRFNKLNRERAKPICALLVCKNILIMLIFGVIRPFLGCEIPYAVMPLCLSATELIVYRFRDDFHECSFFEAAAACSFFGRYFFGPVNCAQNLLTQIKDPPSSVSKAAQGIMRIIIGSAKYAIFSEQFFGIFKTISAMPTEKYSFGLAWLAALSGAMGLYFTLSALSDMAVGIGGIFSLELPKMLYYPFQAVSLREYIYRLNFPLEDTVGRMFFSNTLREEGNAQSYIISFAMPFILALWIAPGCDFLIWGSYMAALILADWLILRRIHVFSIFFSRAVTFLLTLPSYLFLLPCSVENKILLLRAMAGIDISFANDEFFYLLSSNWLLIIIGGFSCTSLFDTINRKTERRFPKIWWAASALGYAALFFVTLSFMLWNVR